MKIRITPHVAIDETYSLKDDAAERDQDQIDAYQRGEWCFIGIQAKAEIMVPSQQGGHWTTVVVFSPGLWGIESNSDPSYLQSIYEEEVATLKEIISQMQRTPTTYTIEAMDRALTR